MPNYVFADVNKLKVKFLLTLAAEVKYKKSV